MTINLEQLTENLKKIIDGFSREATMVDEFIDPVVQGTEVADLKVHLLLWVYLDYCKDVCEALEKMCNKNMPMIAERAERLMIQDMIDSVEFMGKKFSLGTKDYINVTGANKPSVLHWLKNNPLGKSLVAEDYHPASLSKFIKEQYLEKGLAEQVPPTISVFTKKTLTTRKVRRG